MKDHCEAVRGLLQKLSSSCAKHVAAGAQPE